MRANARDSLLNPGAQKINEGMNTNIQLDNFAILYSPKLLHAITKMGGIELMIIAFSNIPIIGKGPNQK
jgi:hypothetical protein